MATTFKVFSLGVQPLIDPTEGNSVSENAVALTGLTFGSAGSPFYTSIQTFSPGSSGFGGGVSNAYDSNNATTNDTFRINGGADRTFDAAVLYNATLTYTDGTTATIFAEVFQDTAGNTYLAPRATADSHQTALEAKPIQSLTLNSVGTNINLAADRVDGTYKSPDGVVQGTGNDDTIVVGYMDAQGDFVDNSGNTIQSSAGNDSIVAGAGNDWIDGGTGNDTIFGAAGNDTIFGSWGSDWIEGGAGDDSLLGDSGSDTILGGEGNDSIHGGNNNDFLQGGAGNDRLEGGNGNDVLAGDDGDDSLLGGTEFDTLDGGAGRDTLLGGDHADFLSGGSGDDRLFGESGADRLDGGTGNDFIDGGDDADTVVFQNGFGNDTVVGGEGGADSDTLDLTGVSGAITVIFSGPEAGTVDSSQGRITFSQIEWFKFANGQTLASGQAGDRIIYDGGSGDGIGGFSGDDTIFGNGGNDNIGGGAGNDVIHGGDGNDGIGGGTGNDLIFGDAGDDGIGGDYGDDTIHGGDGNDGIGGADGNDLIFGGAGNDSIGGEAGNDTLDGGEGDDVIGGGAGDDTIHGGEGQDSLFGNAGKDTLEGGSGNDLLDGGDDDDRLQGGGGDDVLTGGDGNDQFFYAAGDGDDTIRDFNFSGSGVLGDDNAQNNDFINLSGFYDRLSELRGDFDDDGILNQSNAFDYSNNQRFDQGSLTVDNADRKSFRTDNTGVVCFAGGTMILTPTGEVPVERLRPGDLVVTRDDGPQALRWLAFRKLGAQVLAAHPNLRPIRISEGALGNDRALVVSPQHGIVLGCNGAEHLVRATHLARMKGGQARVMAGCKQVTYVHLMFDRHQIVFSNGRATESLLPGVRFLRDLDPLRRREFSILFPEIARAIVVDHCPNWRAVHRYSRWKDLPTFGNRLHR